MDTIYIDLSKKCFIYAILILSAELSESIKSFLQWLPRVIKSKINKPHNPMILNELYKKRGLRDDFINWVIENAAA